MQAPLSREVLVSSALAVADAEGLGAVTIRRLAAEHSVTPMALYWHFQDKTFLMDALAERVLAAVEVPEYPAGAEPTWTARLVDLLSATVAALREHPAVATLVHRRLMSCTPGLALGEACFAALDEGGFSADERTFVGAHAMTSVIALVTMTPFERGPAPSDGSPRRGGPEDQRRPGVPVLDRFPHVASSVSILASAPEAERLWYATGITVLVNGIEALRASSSVGSGSSAP